MAELNKIRFLIFVSLMIFPAHALHVIFSSALKSFKQKSEINTTVVNEEKIYCGTLDRLTYRQNPATPKVIVHIIDRSRFVEIMRNAVRETRFEIAQELKDHNYELVFLGIDDFEDDEYHLIGAFMLHKIQPHNGNEANFTIEIIGEDHFNRAYGIFVIELEMYQENAQICGGALQARLRDIPRGALRPVGRNGKEIRLFEYHPTMGEVKWPVNVINSTYLPKVDVSVPEYNFKIRYPDKKICLLILGGKEYLTAIKDAERLREEAEVTRILDEMTNNNEVLLILGAFNFDWTEIDVVTQIIIQHSAGCNSPADNVFTCGYGMFNTAYLLNVSENIGFPQQPKSIVSELIKILMGEEVKERAIKMHYSAIGWGLKKRAINVANGRYIAEKKFIGYTFPWESYKIAFIVCDSTERNEQFDLSTVYEYVEQLKHSGIYAVVIETIDFGLDDAHIIAEWIDCHRGNIDSEQIAILGAGIFDTIFQSESTTYKTLHIANKNELKAIRDAYVKKGNGKRVFAAYIDTQEFQVRTYPMNTVNGHYEPDLIPDKNIFDTTADKKIFFIITSANRFHRISTMEKRNRAIKLLRQGMKEYYPRCRWTVYLVGLDNFGERDYHLFAELVKMQTLDERSLDKFVRTFDYGIGTPVYQYKDTRPLRSDKKSDIQTLITSFFQRYAD